MRSQRTRSGSSSATAARASASDAGRLDAPPVLLEDDGEEVAQRRFVVDDEEVHGRGLSLGGNDREEVGNQRSSRCSRDMSVERRSTPALWRRSNTSGSWT